MAEIRTIETRSISQINERAALKSFLLSIEIASMMSSELTRDHFSAREHQELFNVFKYLTDRGKTLRDTIILPEIADKPYLIAIYESIRDNQEINENDISDYIKVLSDKLHTRSLIELSKNTLNIINNTNDPPSIIIDEIHKKLINIQHGQDESPTALGDILYNAIPNPNELNPIECDLIGLSTGFKELDKLSSGIQIEDYIIIGARPSLGKTLIALQIATYVAKKYNIPVLFFSIETSKRNILYRILAHTTKINLNQLKKQNLTNDEKTILIEHYNNIKNLPIIVEDDASTTVSKIHSKIRKHQHSLLSRGFPDSYRINHLSTYNSIGLIIIDYLQLVRGNNANRVQEVTDVSWGFKTISKELGIPIIAISQLSRAIETRNDSWTTMPKLSDLRDSGCLSGNSSIEFPDLKKIVKIKDIVNHNNFNLFSHKKENIINKAKKCFRSGYKKTFTLTTIYNHEIKVTKNHKFLTKENEWKRLDELNSNDKIAIPINYNHNNDDITKNDAIFISTIISNEYPLEKYIPDIIFFQNKELLKTFIGALWSNDGSIYYRFNNKTNKHNIRIYYTSISKNIIYGLQNLLGKVGILGEIRITKNRKHSRYCIDIYGKYNIKTFIENIPLFSKRKNEQGDKIKSALNTIRSKRTKFEINGNKTLCFVPIKSIIENDYENVYDIEMNKNHNFISNNILVHNSLDQDATQVWMLTGEPREKNETYISERRQKLWIVKQKDGPLGCVNLLNKMSVGTFIEENELLKF